MINKIYAFGTSHTAGGGFEFNTNNESPNPSIYKKIVNSENHFDFSYPSILSNLTNIEVDNRAKQGYGWEKVTREIYDVINHVNFNQSESLFLIECSSFDRQEYWLNDLNDFIIINCNPNDNHKPDTISIANDYHYQTDSIRDKITELTPLFSNLLNETSNIEVIINKLQTNFLFLTNFLDNNNIKYYLTNGDIPLHPNIARFSQHDKNILQYKLYDFTNNEEIILPNWVDTVYAARLTILDESNGIIKDDHQGYSVSQTIAETIFNRMIDDKLINDIPISLNFLKNWNTTKNVIGYD